ncbi:MAG: hypothetical protein RLZZ232_1642 [Planctomycetota bacterium]
MRTASERLVVGIGSSHGDDQAGWLVAELLQQRLELGQIVLSGCRVRKAAVPLDLLHWLDGVAELIICDACVSEDPDAAVQTLTLTDGDDGQVLEGPRKGIPETPRGSHGYGVMDVLQLLQKTLGRLPATTLWLIPGKVYSPGSEVSEVVRKAVIQVVQEVEHFLVRT